MKSNRGFVEQEKGGGAQGFSDLVVCRIDPNIDRSET